ncbi:hypothetical protein SCLCIDRAFT_1206579 [Scleroderma citrinum Foug A]|uniref:Uncharacterized protein n=1 Tax=Scleroderma citrinum Foug A TaxID=1036808 RepID=A0A0C3A9M6_9AGAM|nr:hypothetical protein SCLCIDRAFT_1206579 [Scleroderma citrinum Foug A]
MLDNRRVAYSVSSVLPRSANFFIRINRLPHRSKKSTSLYPPLKHPTRFHIVMLHKHVICIRQQTHSPREIETPYVTHAHSENGMYTDPQLFNHPLSSVPIVVCVELEKPCGFLELSLPNDRRPQGGA